MNKDNRKTQTTIISLLIFLLLIVSFNYAIQESKFGQPAISPEVEIIETSHNIDEQWKNISDAEYIEALISGMMVDLAYTGPSARLIRWDFGDSRGVDGSPVLHTYAEEGEYLLMMYVEYLDGSTLTEYKIIEIDDGIVEFMNNTTESRWTLLSAVLMWGGIASLIFLGLSIGWDIPPLAFKKRLYVILGIGLIFLSLFAMGCFNSLASIDVQHITPDVVGSGILLIGMFILGVIIFTFAKRKERQIV